MGKKILFLAVIVLLLLASIISSVFSKEIALLLAILLYVSVNSVDSLNNVTASMSNSKEFKDIALTTEVNDSVYEVSGLPTTVDVTLTGDMSDISLATADKQKIVADLTGLTEGTHTIELQALGLTGNTKAIIVVDIGGTMCDYDKIYEVVNAKSLMFSSDKELLNSFSRCVVIADAAHSIGATYKGNRSGAVADFTCFSFHAVKNVTTAEGGAATWKNQSFIDNDLLYKGYMLQSLHGQNKDALAKSKGASWEYDIAAPLYKCNMTDIMAAIGSVQLKRYDEMLKIRKSVTDVFEQKLEDEIYIKPFLSGENFESSRHLYLSSQQKKACWMSLVSTRRLRNWPRR